MRSTWVKKCGEIEVSGKLRGGDKEQARIKERD
jgi:hypothetical protein